MPRSAAVAVQPTPPALALKHTPGPWREDEIRTLGDVERCDVIGPSPTEPGKIRVVAESVLRADAPIITAAPEMLTVLLRLEWCIDVRGVGKCCPNCGGEEIDGHRAGCALGAAIRKATEGA